ncbi:MAG TPA: hypothetical protein VGG64_07710 [Pirellulales bacterium]|jgi:hypothetical protein
MDVSIDDLRGEHTKLCGWLRAAHQFSYFASQCTDPEAPFFGMLDHETYRQHGVALLAKLEGCCAPRGERVDNGGVYAAVRPGVASASFWGKELAAADAHALAETILLQFAWTCRGVIQNQSKGEIFGTKDGKFDAHAYVNGPWPYESHLKEISEEIARRPPFNFDNLRAEVVWEYEKVRAIAQPVDRAQEGERPVACVNEHVAALRNAQVAALERLRGNVWSAYQRVAGLPKLARRGDHGKLASTVVELMDVLADLMQQEHATITWRSGTPILLPAPVAEQVPSACQGASRFLAYIIHNSMTEAAASVNGRITWNTTARGTEAYPPGSPGDVAGRLDVVFTVAGHVCSPDDIGMVLGALYAKAGVPAWMVALPAEELKRLGEVAWVELSADIARLESQFAAMDATAAVARATAAPVGPVNSSPSAEAAHNGISMGVSIDDLRKAHDELRGGAIFAAALVSKHKIDSNSDDGRMSCLTALEFCVERAVQAMPDDVEGAFAAVRAGPASTSFWGEDLAAPCAHSLAVRVCWSLLNVCHSFVPDDVVREITRRRAWYAEHPKDSPYRPYLHEIFREIASRPRFDFDNLRAEVIWEYHRALSRAEAAQPQTNSGQPAIGTGGATVQTVNGPADPAAGAKPAGSVTGAQRTTDRFMALSTFVAGHFKGKQRRVVEMLIEGGGRCKLADMAADVLIDWSLPCDNAFNSICKPLNSKLRRHSYRIIRQDNEARLSELGQK